MVYSSAQNKGEVFVGVACEIKLWKQIFYTRSTVCYETIAITNGKQ